MEKLKGLFKTNSESNSSDQATTDRLSGFMRPIAQTFKKIGHTSTSASKKKKAVELLRKFEASYST